jgi:hypothetical protein
MMDSGARVSERPLLPKRWRWLLYGVLGALVLLSLLPLTEVVGWKVLLGIPAVALVILLARWSRFCRALAEVVGAILVPWLCLIGFNQLIHWFATLWEKLFGAEPEPSLEFGLVLAGLAFAVASLGYLLAWEERKWAAPFVALALAVANVVGVPLLLGAPHRETAVAVPQQVVSQLDVTIVVPAGSPERLRESEPARGVPDWDVHYSVARGATDTLEWLLLDSTDAQAALAAARGDGQPVPGAPTRREGADQLVLLNVDGVPPVIPNPRGLPSLPGTRGEVRRWLKIAHAAAPDAAVAVLLQSTDPKRRAAWAGRVEPAGGSVASIQEQGAHTLTDAALVLAAQAPGTSEDLALAMRYRPVLLFDEGEKLHHTPLDINTFLASGRVDLCHDDKLKGATCDRIGRASDLISGSTHLRIRKRKPGGPEPASAIYVHPRHVRDLVILDYWWYLDGNPARIAGGTSCGVGLSLPGKTCFDHDSDWEGVTVVLKGSGDDAAPVAVQYAEHSDVVRYDYAQLVEDWKVQRERNRAWQSARFRRNLARIDDVEGRPLAFVALGSHAAYRDVCTARCEQVVEKGRPENSRDGLVSWPENDTAHCIATGCLRLIPTRHGGRDPALWNAYEGVWGERRCILRGAYCNAEVSPGAPATQKRYTEPLRITGYVDGRWKAHACGGDGPECPPLQ